MPIFEYVCDQCGKRFEKLVRRSDTNGIECPSCGDTRLTQQLSTFAAHAGGSKERATMPSCPNSGGCPNAGMCGMN